ncbi:hypothetical protein GCM10009830_26060 [Glycomyces endophyticus]|uniref:Uncharacterized protein n=1 Tax=Glycomyces endophyticus TaxID=480996 RepID=A0ABP4SUN5_9ACTN
MASAITTPPPTTATAAVTLESSTALRESFAERTRPYSPRAPEAPHPPPPESVQITLKKTKAGPEQMLRPGFKPS